MNLYSGSFPNEINIDSKIKNTVLIGQLMGGILVVNTISLSVGILGNIVKDLTENKLEGFLVTPVTRMKLILSYYITAVMVTFIFTIILYMFTIVYIAIVGTPLSIVVILQGVGLLIIYTFISTSIMLFLVTLIKSSGAFATLSSIAGTLVGFISGAYMPLFMLGESVSKIAGSTPFSHMVIYLRQILILDSYDLISGMTEIEKTIL